jgi:hypothetical protein
MKMVDWSKVVTLPSNSTDGRYQVGMQSERVWRLYAKLGIEKPVDPSDNWSEVFMTVLERIADDSTAQI